MAKAPSKKPRFDVKKPGEWYSKRIYRKGQPFRTFIQNARRLNFVIKEMRSIVPNPTKCTAIEIGPGNIPLISQLPFKRKFFVDFSHAIAKNLRNIKTPLKVTKENLERFEKHHEFSKLSEMVRKKKEPFVLFSLAELHGKRERVLTGDITQPPFKPGTKFDIGVMSEVLANVPPEERINAVKRIAELSNSLLIIDRQQISEKKIARDVMNLTREELSKIGYKRGSKLLTKTTRKVKRKREIRLRAFSKQEKMRQVDFFPIVTMLEKEGWEVKKINKSVWQKDEPGKTTNYTILKAKKKH